MSDAPRPRGPRSIAGSVALGVLAFSATLILLFGLVSWIGRSGGGSAGTLRATGTQPASSATDSATPPVATSTPSAAPSRSISSAAPSASSDPVLVGAGDIADCTLDS